jgi:hypothetical protein
MNALVPINTEYLGFKFRSRLEARVAKFFHCANIEFGYEIEGFSLPSGYYLPDFWLPGMSLRGEEYRGCWLEVKPPNTDCDQVRLRELGESSGSPAILCCGLPNSFSWPYGNRRTIASSDNMYQIWPPWDNCLQFMKCYFCGAIKIEFMEGSYMFCHKCGGKSDDQHPDLVSAMYAASIARFEHGEC